MHGRHLPLVLHVHGHPLLDDHPDHHRCHPDHHPDPLPDKLPWLVTPGGVVEGGQPLEVLGDQLGAATQQDLGALRPARPGGVHQGRQAILILQT